MGRSSRSSSSKYKPTIQPTIQPTVKPTVQPTIQPTVQPLSSSGGVISNIATIASAHLISTGISNILFGKNKDNTNNTTNICNDSFQKYQECMKVNSEFDANQCKTLYEDFQKCFNSFNKT